MKTTYYRILFIIGLLITAASCKKSESSGDPDPAQVSIIRSAPQSSQVFHKGDTVKMNAVVTAPFELHGYELIVTNETTGAVVYDVDEHVHDDHFNLEESWADTISGTAALKVMLTVELDHNGHSKSDSVMISTQP